MKDEETLCDLRIFAVKFESSFANSSKRHYNRRTFDSELMDRETQPIPCVGLALPEFPGGSLESSPQHWSGFSLRPGIG